MTDQFTVRTVVLGLLALALSALGGIIYLAAVHTPSPDVLQNVAIGSMAALAGILAKTSTVDRQPVVTAERADVDVTTRALP